MKAPANKARFRIRLMLTSMTITTVIAIVAALFAIPPIKAYLQQRQMLRQLQSPNGGERLEALTYSARQLQIDEDYRAEVFALLPDLSRQYFVEVAQMLDSLEMWNRDTIPAAGWLRWIGDMSENESENTRLFAAQELANLPALADDARVHELLGKITADDAPLVRLNAMTAAIELAGLAEQKTTYTAMLATLAADEQSAIARQAWIALKLLDHPVGDEVVQVALDRDDPALTAAVQFYRDMLASTEPSQDRVAATREPSEEELPSALVDPRTEIRDVACITAARTWPAAEREMKLRDMLKSA
ncbi:MAG: hypothetical protein MI741_22520, partial [Rhodospirillales bacterium]|nr:hypothetical protein [Rhodospirillales bacterium]